MTPAATLALMLVVRWPVLVYLGMSVLTFVLYAIDKGRAVRGKWRITETMLHGCELLGGWPGALVAQQALRHKNRKAGYQVVFWLIVLVHVVGWAWWFGWVRVS